MSKMNNKSNADLPRHSAAEEGKDENTDWLESSGASSTYSNASYSSQNNTLPETLNGNSVEKNNDRSATTRTANPMSCKGTDDSNHGHSQGNGVDLNGSVIVPTDDPFHSQMESTIDGVTEKNHNEQSLKERRNLSQELTIELPKSQVPSPAISPRNWKAVKPGYSTNSWVAENRMKMKTKEGSLRDLIPAMPKPLAIVCLIVNVIISGLGTFLAGISVLGCSQIRGGSDAGSVIWINTCVMFLQIITTPLLLFGWFWSIFWGISFVKFSEYYRPEGLAEGSPGRQSNISDNDPAVHRARAQRRRMSLDGGHVSTPLSVNESTMPQCGSDQLGLPIIVLHEAPVVNPSEVNMVIGDVFQPTACGSRYLNPNNPRHQSVLRRQDAQELFPPVVLDPDALNDVLVRNGISNGKRLME